MAPGDQPPPVNRRLKKQKHRRAVQAKKGDAWVADEDYVPRAVVMEKQAWGKRLEKSLRYLDDDVPSGSVPMDCQWEALGQNDPQIHRKILDGAPLLVNKKDDLQRNRIIWYNGLDDRHTFNRRNKHASMNCALVRLAIYDNPPRPVSKVMLLYLKACQEQLDTPKISQDRETFLREWIKPESDDIYIFSYTEMKKLCQSFGRIHANLVKEVTQKQDTDELERGFANMEMENAYEKLAKHYESWGDGEGSGKSTEEYRKMGDLVNAAIDFCDRALTENPFEENNARLGAEAEHVIGIQNTVDMMKKVDDLWSAFDNVSI